MNEKLTTRQLRRMFPSAPESFIKANAIDYYPLGVPGQSEQVDQSQTGEAPRSEEVREINRKCFVQVEFFAGHGQELDEDNRRYIAKPILDALVNLGFSKTDKLFKSEVTQRMDTNCNYL